MTPDYSLQLTFTRSLAVDKNCKLAGNTYPDSPSPLASALERVRQAEAALFRATQALRDRLANPRSWAAQPEGPLLDAEARARWEFHQALHTYCRTKNLLEGTSHT